MPCRGGAERVRRGDWKLSSDRFRASISATGKKGGAAADSRLVQEPSNRPRVAHPSNSRGSDPMPAKQKTLNDLFLDGLKDIFHAEKQTLRALPKMARAVNN